MIPETVAAPEVWLRIPHLSTRRQYWISDLGRVASTGPDGAGWRVLSAVQNVDKRGEPGYFKVNLGRAVQAYVHHLVASAFLGPRPDGMDVDHVEHDRRDNRAISLRYRPIRDNRADTSVNWTAWEADARGERAS